MRPLHPYTEILMTSIPVTDPSVDPRDAITVSGELPSPIAPPSGCRFRTRCPRAAEVCATDEPVLRDMGAAQFVACHFPLEHPSPNGARELGLVGAPGGS